MAPKEVDHVHREGIKGEDLEYDKTDFNHKFPTEWRKVIILGTLHLLLLRSLYLLATQFNFWHLAYAWTVFHISGIGTTVGTHRMWCHRAFKARLPLRIFLAFLHTITLQVDIYQWSRDHRVHHKFTETDADPYNAARGFFFSHMGWLMVKKHPDVKEKGNTIDCSDLLRDPVVYYQRKYYWYLAPFCAVGVPVGGMMYLFGTDFWYSFFIGFVLQIVMSFHSTWTINSFAHMFGDRPYDVKKNPRNVGIFHLLCTSFVGEGFHNFHHAFPFDYRISEFGKYMNNGTAFIDLMAKIGQAYDLKKATPDMVAKARLSVLDATGKSE